MVSDVMFMLTFSPCAAMIRHWHSVRLPPEELKDIVPEDSRCVEPQPVKKEKAGVVSK